VLIKKGDAFYKLTEEGLNNLSNNLNSHLVSESQLKDSIRKLLTLYSNTEILTELLEKLAPNKIQSEMVTCVSSFEFQTRIKNLE